MGKQPGRPRRRNERVCKSERKNVLAWIAQKVFGLLLIAAAVACFVLVADGETLQERDGGGALILCGIGLYLLFTRKQISL